MLTFWQLSGSRKLARAILWSSNRKTPWVGGVARAKPRREQYAEERVMI